MRKSGLYRQEIVRLYAGDNRFRISIVDIDRKNHSSAESSSGTHSIQKNPLPAVAQAWSIEKTLPVTRAKIRGGPVFLDSDSRFLSDSAAVCHAAIRVVS